MSPHRCDESQHAVGLAARIAAVAACVLATPGAYGQASGTVSLVSEYSARGVSLSDRRAVPQLSLSYDGAGGWYAGLFAVPRLVQAGYSGVTQVVAYGGYVQQLSSGLSWEAGASSTSFTDVSSYNYREIFVGLASDRLGGRVYFSPAYYGAGGRVAYAELNGFYPLLDGVKLIGHAGLLRGLGRPASYVRDRVDLRLALAFDVGRFNVQLAWLRSAGVGSGAPRYGERAPRALSLSASYSF